MDDEAFTRVNALDRAIKIAESRGTVVSAEGVVADAEKFLAFINTKGENTNAL